MGLLNKERLLTKSLLSIQKVELGKGDFVFVREMTGRERDSFEKMILVDEENEKGETVFKRNFKDFRAKIVTMTMCDEKGNLLLDITDVEKLSTCMSASQLEKIVKVTKELNKMDVEDSAELVKNLEAGDTPGKTSASV